MLCLLTGPSQFLPSWFIQLHFPPNLTDHPSDGGPVPRIQDSRREETTWFSQVDPLWAGSHVEPHAIHDTVSETLVLVLVLTCTCVVRPILG